MNPRSYDFLCDLKPPNARMLLGPDINVAKERANQSEAIPLQLTCYNSSAPITNVKIRGVSRNFKGGGPQFKNLDS